MREYLGINENGRSTPGGKQDATFAEANMESIYIGEGVHVASRFRTFFSFTGFLVSFSESISAGERTYQLEYFDRSVILDKIFVGLTNRHAAITNPVGGEAEVRALCGKLSIPKDLTFQFGTTTGLGPKLNTARVGSYIPYFQTLKEEYFGGGTIIVGDEQFSENFCSIPAVDYAFKDLIDGMASAGITSIGDFGAFKSSGYGLRREYSGTLRTVLSSWCAEYGLFYLWDETEGTSKKGAVIRFYDMREGVGNISAIKNKMLGLGVENLEFSQTKENTQFKSLVTRFIKPPSITESTINFSTKVPSSPITLSQISARNQINGHEGVGFLTSCALAKANADVRTLWYISRGARGRTMGWEALGIYILRHPGDNTFYGTGGKGILKSVYIEEYAQIARDFNVDNESGIQAGPNINDNLELYLIYKSDDMESRFLEWEKSIASDFVGKFWKTAWVSTHPDTSTCASLYGRRGKIADSNPNFLDVSDQVIPEISMDPYGGKIISNSPVPTYGINNVVKRDSAQWGTSLEIDVEKEVKDITPRFVPVTAEHYDLLLDAGIIDGEVAQDFSLGGAKFQLGFLFVRRDLRKKIQFTVLQNDPNPLELIDAEVNSFNSEGDISDCKPDCTIDIGQLICGDTSQNGSNFQPSLLNRESFSVEVSGSFGIKGKVHAPVGAVKGAIFYRIETINFSNYLSKRGIKSFKFAGLNGAGDKSPLQSASIDVVDEDMSNGVVFTSSTNGNNTVLNGSSYIVWDGVGIPMGDVSRQTNSALERYHQRIKETIPTSSEVGPQTLSATLPGKMFSELRGEISLESGLSSLSFSFGSNGSSTKISFRNVPKERVSKDLLIPTFKILTSHFRN
jgi:hypothetical protein